MKRLKDFSRKQIREIATVYATTELACNYSYFEKEYEISETTFYNILKKAIIESIVDDEIAKQIGRKTEKNSAKKAGKGAGIRSRRHQEDLLLKRKAFKMKKSEAIKIAIRYSKSNFNKKQFCLVNIITIKLFDDALVRAITENWVDDECYERIKSKALKNHNNSSKACELFQKLDNIREEHKQGRR